MEEPAEDLVLALQGENADDLSRLASLQKIEGLLDEAAGPDAEHLCALLRAAGLRRKRRDWLSRQDGRS